MNRCRYDFSPDGLELERFSNSILIKPKDDIASAYAWLKSADRDGQMGALAESNRRTLVLLPGDYSVSNFIIDTDYVDIVGLTDNPKSVRLYCNTAGTAVTTQTANAIALANFTIGHSQSVAGSYGLVISASNNSPSVYKNLEFRNANSGKYTSEPVWFTTSCYGTWYNCIADNWGWRGAPNMNFGPTMYDCVTGRGGFGGDNNNDLAGTGVISGSFYRCHGGAECFGGCTTYGMSFTGYAEDCIVGEGSFALGRTFSGTAIRCQAGFCSFAGQLDVAYPGTFSGIAIDCSSDGGLSFGMGQTASVQSGTIINCRNGLSFANITIAATSTVTNAAAKATVNTNFATANSNLTFTAKSNGRWGNKIYVRIRSKTIGANIDIASGYDYQNNYRWVSATVNQNTHTASNVITAIQANATANALLDVVAYDGDGSGKPGAIGSTGVVFYLIGGMDAPCFSGNAPKYPIELTANATAYAFDNGATYTNTGATGGVTVTLPAAIVGLEYKFHVIASQNFIIQRSGTNTFSDSATSKTCATPNAILKVKCYVDGTWTFETVGTWS